MKLLWSDEAWEDYQYWRKTNLQIWKMVKALIRHTQQSPYQGLGRPKALQHDLKGYWSRRITDEHRTIAVSEDGFLDDLRAATNGGWALGRFKRQIAEAPGRRVVPLPKGRPPSAKAERGQLNLL